jgi:haloalkane dehalogenase
MSADWIDRNEYPFEGRFFDQPAGRMHYIDEGNADHAIVMVHGNPTWSFLYRHMIKGLSGAYRCIAPDHLGFGLSEKPSGWDYLPESHAENFARLLDALDLASVTMAVQDWGGPIGAAYALDHPEKIQSIIIMNTWCWPVVGDPHFEKFSGFMGSPIGQFLIKRFNLFARLIMKQAFGDSSKLTSAIHSHYLKPLGSPRERKGCAAMPKRILGSSQWLEELWARKEILRQIPALILWGKKDIAFRDKELNTWKTAFESVEVHEFDQVGHYVQEEMGAALCPPIKKFLAGQVA